VVKLAVEARQLDSLLSKYLNKYRKAIGDGDLLRFHMYQLRAGEEDRGTVSGRYSSADVNIQQVYKAERQEEEIGGLYIIRELFEPDDGFDFFSADASQIEFRLFGHYSGSRKLINAYRENPRQDFHQLVADLFRQPRYQAKNNNFGKLYGMGRRKTALRLGLPCGCGCPDQDFWNNDCHEADCPAVKANAIIDEYDREFPEAKRLMRSAMRLAETRGYVKTLLGRVARFPKKQRLHAALNRVIQGSAADLFKLKLWRLYQERATLGLHKIRLLVHDEVAGDQERDPNKRRLLEECLAEQEIELKVPILWDTAWGKTWKDVA
jgi:DNA polymerase I-like protein with 3'-5' exonuclease and polymerase domains